IGKRVRTLRYQKEWKLKSFFCGGNIGLVLFCLVCQTQLLHQEALPLTRTHWLFAINAKEFRNETAIDLKIRDYPQLVQRLARHDHDQHYGDKSFHSPNIKKKQKRQT